MTFTYFTYIILYLFLHSMCLGHTKCTQINQLIQTVFHKSLLDMAAQIQTTQDNKTQACMGLGVSYLG